MPFIFLPFMPPPVRKIRVQEFLGCLKVTPAPQPGKPFFSQKVAHDNTWDAKKVKPIFEQLEQLGWIDFTDSLKKFAQNGN